MESYVHYWSVSGLSTKSHRRERRLELVWLRRDSLGAAGAHLDQVIGQHSVLHVEERAQVVAAESVVHVEADAIVIAQPEARRHGGVEGLLF